MTQTHVQDEFDQLREALSSPERIMHELLANKTWERRGYESLTRAWTPVMGDTEIHTPVLRIMIARQMLDEGASQDTVFNTVKGLGPSFVAAAAAAREAGLSADEPRLALAGLGTTRRESKDGTRTIRIKVQGLQFYMWNKRAELAGVSVEEVVFKAAEAAFAAMALAQEQAQEPQAS